MTPHAFPIILLAECHVEFIATYMSALRVIMEKLKEDLPVGLRHN
jgi:hypothetical protein